MSYTAADQDHEAGQAAYLAHRARHDAANFPRSYVEVNADTGETVERPERCRPADRER